VAVASAAPRSSQITTPAPAPLCFFTGRMTFLPPNQQRQSTEGTVGAIHAYTHTNLHSAKK